MELNLEKVQQSLFEHIVHSSKDPRMAQMYIETEADLCKSRQALTFLEYAFVTFLDDIDHYLSFLKKDQLLCRKHKSEIDRLDSSMMYARKAVGC
ncbi:MAG: hypothetical protein JXB48_11070 [Candidatus Latescibacteria bacterium]|nr:hypothetical protein [Candidatus Latescibacterota bacterium]